VGQEDKNWLLVVKAGSLGPLLAAKSLRDPAFFPFAGDAIDHAAPQQARIGADSIAFHLKPAPNASLSAKPLNGIIEYEAKQGGGWVRRAVEISAAPGPVSAVPPAAALGLIAALAFALLGGLILNVMPCVFPVLSIKALSLARAGDERAARRHGLFFLAGVMATFLTLAGLLIALQAAGAQIGWGFQLQAPLVVGALALLFFVIGLNLLGAFEVGAGAAALGAGLAQRGGDAGAFFTGALAVAAATPCTAPFMGAALGFAATQAPATSLLVFAALGLGFAAPFFALSVAPPLRALLPRPGAWMDTLKQILAFPMFAAAIWLVWVLAQQRGANGALMALVSFLAFAFLAWTFKALKAGVGRRIAAAAALAVLLAAGAALAALPEARPGALARAGAEPWSPGREAQLRAAGKPVFVDFTAAWCITCQINERIALKSPRVVAAFANQGVSYLIADWTSGDAAIAEELKARGRAGVPLYLYYAAGAAANAPPKILPQLLTPAIVLDALGARHGG
jgi:thiol:disulfide interchange protein DsbD